MPPHPKPLSHKGGRAGRVYAPSPQTPLPQGERGFFHHIRSERGFFHHIRSEGLRRAGRVGRVDTDRRHNRNGRLRRGALLFYGEFPAPTMDQPIARFKASR